MNKSKKISIHGTCVAELLRLPVRDPFIAEMIEELEVAQRSHNPMNSVHEAYAVILEELDEFWEECKKKLGHRDPDLMRIELMQIAAMACRAAIDLKL